MADFYRTIYKRFIQNSGAPAQEIESIRKEQVKEHGNVTGNNGETF